MERTVIDIIADCEKIGAIEELLRCIQLIPSLSSKGLLAALEMHGSGRLYQKTGYILEFYKQEFNLPDSFFEECERHLPNCKTYFSTEKRGFGFLYHNRWKIYGPRNLESWIDN